jgi:hypothetical protein
MEFYKIDPINILTKIVHKGKGIIHPRTGHEGPEGELRYSCTVSLTLVLDGGVLSTPHPGLITPRKDQVPIV